MDIGIIATHVPPALGYGGVATTAGILTRAWSEQRRKIAVVASDESIERRLNPEDVLMGKDTDVRLYRSYGFRRWGFGLGAIPAIYKLCKQAPVVYIHGIATWPCTLAAWLCRLMNKPYMVALHGGLMPEHLTLIRRSKPHKWLYYKFITFPSLHRALAIHCTSETEIQGAREALGVDAHVLLVPNGVDSRDVAVAPPPAREGLQICFLGHIQAEKGINAFIRAWLQVRRPHDRLVVAGRSVDAAYFHEFESLIEQAQGAVDYRGYLSRTEVNQLLAESHYLVLPSGLEESGGMRENFGNVVAEAMAAGRPVLVARGLAWDEVEAQGTGYVFERNAASVMQILRKIQGLDAASWLALSLAARRYVETRLDPVKLGERVWQVLSASGDQPSVTLNREASAHD
ncbi:glycosyltransferase family 4 protein [Methylococcus sp. EFPC2]|uniref:glycosyltransferase family 4 protein n=1 Tax=Methylococcus sp. EFPC2 TaxID=2812648 RepID=UPI001967B606|nr:glycosyltransferase [Methylococcus sp. EFPC2]QSA98584.1 glycosyltransferase [Methylococcus sp. EFPC2]